MNYTIEDIELIEDWWIKKSRVNFFAYRQYMRYGNFEHNWFIADLCKQLQQFYVDLRAGKRPILMIQSPPQHGKTWSVTDFISWMSGLNPEIRSIYATFSDKLGTRCNLAQQRMIDSEKYSKIFPDIKLSSKRGEAVRTTNHLEFLDKNGVVTGGQFRNTTTGGPITGESLDCVSGETKVITDTGERSIKCLKLIDSPVRVLSFNHTLGRSEFEEVTYIKKIKKYGILRISDINGRILECTPNHQIYTENRGYIRADSLSTRTNSASIIGFEVAELSGIRKSIFSVAL